MNFMAAKMAVGSGQLVKMENSERKGSSANYANFYAKPCRRGWRYPGRACFTDVTTYASSASLIEGYTGKVTTPCQWPSALG